MALGFFRRKNGPKKFVTKEGSSKLPGPEGIEGKWAGCCDRRRKPFTNRPPTGGRVGSVDGLYCNRFSEMVDETEYPRRVKSARYSMDCNFPDLICLLECMLSFHACYKYHPDPASHPNFSPNICFMLGMLRTYVDRGGGTKQWRISKFHES